jgi:hypothetical protein
VTLAALETAGTRKGCLIFYHSHHPQRRHAGIICSLTRFFGAALEQFAVSQDSFHKPAASAHP